jgi:hypothetical protein
LSAFRAVPPSRTDYRIIVVTDNPAPYQGLRVQTELISPNQMTEWLGSRENNNRRQIAALRHVLAKTNTPSMLVDGDTYFRASPDALFDWIVPGKTIMHMDEGPIKHLKEHRFLCELVASHPFRPAAWPEFCLTPDFHMWNAGVIGLHPADIGLLDKALLVCDAMWDWQRYKYSVQTSLNAALGTRSHRREAAGVIFHYWRPYLRKPFREAMQTFMPLYENLPEAERAEKCWHRRPRPPPFKRLRCGLKSMIHQLGLTQVGLRSNG